MLATSVSAGNGDVTTVDAPAVSAFKPLAPGRMNRAGRFMKRFLKSPELWSSVLGGLGTAGMFGAEKMGKIQIQGDPLQAIANIFGPGLLSYLGGGYFGKRKVTKLLKRLADPAISVEERDAIAEELRDADVNARLHALIAIVLGVGGGIGGWIGGEKLQARKRQ